MIDVNVHLSRWPFRRLPCDETPKLLAALRRAGITQAWAGSFDALLHRDVAAVNARLADECRASEGLLVPFGAVNPTLPDWQEDVRRCHEEHRMPGLRLYPGYHGYKLDDPLFAELVELAQSRGLILQIAVLLEDERTQHSLVQVAHVNPEPLIDLTKKHPNAKFVLLNPHRAVRGELVGRLVETGRIWFDTSNLEGTGGIERLLKSFPAERLLLGSHFPFFYLEAALLKLRESELAAFQREALTVNNARGLLADWDGTAYKAN